MYGYFFQYGIVLLQLKPVRRIFPVLGWYIAWSSRHSTLLMLCAFQNNLYPVSFFSHFLLELIRFKKSFFNGLVKRDFKSVLIDGANCLSRNTDVYIPVFFFKIKLFIEEIRLEGSFGPSLWVRYIVSHHHLLSCYLTNFRHFSFEFQIDSSNEAQIT